MSLQSCLLLLLLDVYKQKKPIKTNNMVKIFNHQLLSFSRKVQRKHRVTLPVGGLYHQAVGALVIIMTLLFQVLICLSGI